MTELDTYTPSAASTARAAIHPTTIYRDTAFVTPAAWQTPSLVQANLRRAVQHDEHVSDGILVGLAALTVPAVVYSLAQLWTLVSGSNLEHAIRAFLP